MREFPVNKVPYDGPNSYPKLLDRITEDAKKEGIDFITPKIVNSVIQHIFSVRGALGGIPHFVLNSIVGFGRWIPNQSLVKLRKQYYIDRIKHKRAFSKQLELNRRMVKRCKAAYSKYFHSSTAEITMTYLVWKKATGRKRKLDTAYRKLNKLRTDFMKLEREKYNYITIKKEFKRKNFR